MTTRHRTRHRMDAFGIFMLLLWVVGLGGYAYVMVTRGAPSCQIQHAYVEGDVVMVTDVAEPLTIVSLVCRDGRWVPVSQPGVDGEVDAGWVGVK